MRGRMCGSWIAILLIWGAVQAWPAHPRTTADITPADISARMQALIDKSFAGRQPGTHAGAAAAQWIAEALARLGISPGNHGSYFQHVPTEVIALNHARSQFRFETAKGPLAGNLIPEMVFWSSHYGTPEVRLLKSHMVFVGDGIVAPEQGRDAYRGTDVRGKTVLIDMEDGATGYYASAAYKFAEAARHGAAAVLLIAHKNWSAVRAANAGPKSWLQHADKNASRAAIEGWISPALAGQIFAAVGRDLARERAAAMAKDFSAQPLYGIDFSVNAYLRARSTSSRNVIGVLHGSADATDKLILSAHWDGASDGEGTMPHGGGTIPYGGGTIAYGDGAAAVAGLLEIAEKFSRAGPHPKRSVVFLFPTGGAEENLGTKYYVSHPLWPDKHIVANIHLSTDYALSAPSAAGAKSLKTDLQLALKADGIKLVDVPLGQNFAFARSGIPQLNFYPAVADGMSENTPHTEHYSLMVKAVFRMADKLAGSQNWPNWSVDTPFRANRDKIMVQAYPGHRTTEVAFSQDDIRYRVKALSDDAFAGRGPGTEAGEAAAQWIADELKKDGVAPGARGDYFQKVPIAQVTLLQSESGMAFHTAHGTITPKMPDDMVFWTPSYAAQKIDLKALPVVFAGYGVVAPEYGWNDYKGIDVKGKAVIVLVNDPGFGDPKSGLFNGKAMTYYGRWTYKFEEAARQGAAAVLIVHETEPASYGWQVLKTSHSTAQSWLISPDRNASEVAIQGWMTHETAESLLQDAGMDFAKMKAAALKPGFAGVELPGVKLDVKAAINTRYLETRNVIGMVRGSRRPSEVVMYSAHWDHLGVNPAAKGADKIYNGAIDNGMGVAMTLELAQKFAHGPRPERTVVFLFSALEEQGLLGTEFFVRHPLWQLKHIVGDINLDGTHPCGPTRDMMVSGSGQNDLEDELAGALKAQGRHLTPDQKPEAGHFYRADHFSFAKAGVPAISPVSGYDWVEGGVAAGAAAAKAYYDKQYHQPSDSYDPNWDLRGPMEDLDAVYAVGKKLANSEIWPGWKAGSEFKARREEEMKR